MDESRLLALKRKVEDAKAQVAELRGKKSYLEQELKETWQCSTTTEAERLLTKLEEEAKALSGKIERGTKELQERYEL